MIHDGTRRVLQGPFRCLTLIRVHLRGSIFGNLHPFQDVHVNWSRGSLGHFWKHHGRVSRIQEATARLSLSPLRNNAKARRASPNAQLRGERRAVHVKQNTSKRALTSTA